ncbi:phytoene desaturase family protein, partial [Nocardia farcinica]|uniref:phytoene desaturase family protein n=1 Tax=Nocardia farcinica TaxID=37329 RepID=UPI002453E4DC
MSTAVVVGSGPNGLAGAIVLARAGLSVTVLEAEPRLGGGARSREAIVPGLLHDECSAIHPMAVGSPFLRDLELDRYGLRWAWPERDCVHPLDDGSAGVLHRDVAATAAGLGGGGRAGGARVCAGPPGGCIGGPAPSRPRPQPGGAPGWGAGFPAAGATCPRSRSA